MDNIRNHLKNGIAYFKKAQILDYKRTKKSEILKTPEQTVFVEFGKNANKVKRPTYEDKKATGIVAGNYYYWYTKPLHNYYHMFLDGLGCLYRYLEFRKDVKNLKLLINESPNGLEKHPPFIKELLDMLEIEYQFTTELFSYENLWIGDTLNQNKEGVRIAPKEGQYKMIEMCIRKAQSSYHRIRNVPTYEKIYLSRRTADNPKYNKNLIGEDNTKKRGLVNETEVVEVLHDLGYKEVFGENFNVAEKIVLFNKMKKYITSAGAGVTNILWATKPLSVGGIHTPGFPFPSEHYARHIIHQPYYKHVKVNVYPGQVSYAIKDVKHYNSPWRINSIKQFRDWASQI